MGNIILTADSGNYIHFRLVIVVLSGSVPPDINKNIYQQWIKAVKEKGAKVILDADGEQMRQGFTTGPYLIKPNIHELEGLLGRKLNNVAEIIHAVNRIESLWMTAKN